MQRCSRSRLTSRMNIPKRFILTVLRCLSVGVIFFSIICQFVFLYFGYTATSYYLTTYSNHSTNWHLLSNSSYCQWSSHHINQGSQDLGLQHKLFEEVKHHPDRFHAYIMLHVFNYRNCKQFYKDQIIIIKHSFQLMLKDAGSREMGAHSRLQRSRNYQKHIRYEFQKGRTYQSLKSKSHVFTGDDLKITSERKPNETIERITGDFNKRFS